MNTAKQLIAELKKRSDGTPYQIESDGSSNFTVKLDVVDTSYYFLMYKNGVKRAFSIQAKIDSKNRTVQTTDSLYALDWQVGSDPTDVKPRINWDVAVQQGEIYAFERRADIGVTKSGQLGLAVNYGYNTRAAKKWLDQQLKELGWRRVWGTQAKIGLVVGVIAIIGALATVITLLAILLFAPEYFNS